MILDYHIASNEELEERGYGDHWEDLGKVLVGPDGFECMLGEPEDCSFYRDAADVVHELNKLLAKLENV